MADHKTLVVAAGGHWNDACYRRICYFRMDWSMCDTLSEGKIKVA